MAPDEQSRVQRIKQYVLARLREELGTAPRGAQARLAKKLGVSGAHLSNMLSSNPTRQPGEDFRRKVAAHWGVSYAQLEALSLGEETPASLLQTRLDSDDQLPPNLALALSEYVWMPELPLELRTVVQEQARLYHVFGGRDFSSDEWRRVLTGLEREALSVIARRPTSSSPSSRAVRKKRLRRVDGA